MADAQQRKATQQTPQRILLTGFMGAGKTTVGILLAERLGWRFIDLDQHLEAQHHKTISEIFAHHGEPHFRTLESDSLAQILGANNIVIALGGGALESAANRAAITATDGTSLVFLDAPFDTLMHRVATQRNAPPRPLLADRQVADARHTARQPQYRSADLHIDTTSLNPDTVAEQIIADLGLHTLSQDRPNQ